MQHIIVSFTRERYAHELGIFRVAACAALRMKLRTTELKSQGVTQYPGRTIVLGIGSEILARGRVNRHPTRIMALNGISTGVAIAAEELNSAAGDVGSGLGREELGHGSVHGVILVILLLHSGSVNEVLGSLSAGVHVGQLELGVLELCDGAAKLLALLDIGDGLVDGSLGNAQSLGAMPIRPPSSVAMASWKPLPSRPADDPSG